MPYRGIILFKTGIMHYVVTKALKMDALLLIWDMIKEQKLRVDFVQGLESLKSLQKFENK